MMGEMPSTNFLHLLSIFFTPISLPKMMGEIQLKEIMIVPKMQSNNKRKKMMMKFMEKIRNF